MALDWAVLIAGVAGAVFLFTQAGRLTAQPRRGTAWRPSVRAYKIAAIAPLLAAVGAALSLLNA